MCIKSSPLGGGAGGGVTSQVIFQAAADQLIFQTPYAVTILLGISTPGHNRRIKMKIPVPRSGRQALIRGPENSIVGYEKGS